MINDHTINNYHFLNRTRYNTYSKEVKGNIVIKVILISDTGKSLNCSTIIF